MAVESKRFMASPQINLRSYATAARPPACLRFPSMELSQQKYGCKRAALASAREHSGLLTTLSDVSASDRAALAP